MLRLEKKRQKKRRATGGSPFRPCLPSALCLFLLFWATNRRKRRIRCHGSSSSSSQRELGSWLGQRTTSAAAGRGADGTTHAQLGGGLGLWLSLWGVFIRGCSFSLFLPVAISILARCLCRALLLTPFQPEISR